MKKINLFIAICSLSITSIKAQYGTIDYPHPNTTLSSGVQGISSPGFILGGHTGLITTGNNNFYIDRTNVNGAIGGMTPPYFQNAYRIFGNSSCNALPQILNVKGVSVIEANGRNYVTGLLDFGIFFAELAPNGAVTNQKLYFFPLSGPPTTSTKPLITASVINPGRFYIAGSFNGVMYMMNIDNTGIPGSGLGQYATDITISNGVSFDPRAIVESPYTGQLVIIGAATVSSGNTVGYYYSINSTFTTPGNRFFYFHNVAGVTLGSEFSSIVLSNQGTGGQPGFLIGGLSRSTMFQGRSWFVKLDQLGNLVWSSMIQSANSPVNMNVKGVTERFSAFNNINECYGVAQINQGAVVFKLSNTGVPMHLLTGFRDEFLHVIAGAVLNPIALTNNNIGLPDEGLQIYAGYGNRHHLIQSYFSGETGCNVNAIIPAFDQTPPTVKLFTDKSVTVLKVCTNFAIQLSNSAAYSPVCGPFPVVAGASNQRGMATGIKSNDMKDVLVYPNPTNGKLFIEAGQDDMTGVQIKLTDLLGRVINVDATISSGTIEIDLDGLNISQGVYYLEATINGTVTKQKIVYSAK